MEGGAYFREDTRRNGPTDEVEEEADDGHAMP
jgi:hypothetical protein